MSFGKPVSPGKNQVWDAFKYAESKGVLLVKAAGNENEDIAEHQYFPTNFKKQTDDKPFVNNMIVVGASTNDNGKLKASFSNFNKKMVNVFAPGDKIYSSVPTNTYKYEQGTSMASPVVAGAAAVLKAYMPNLTPAQMIESLEKSVNKSANNGFENLSVAGGVIDVQKAAEYAYTHFYKAGSVKAVPVKAKKAPKKVSKK
jgi:subtilisin family serine protease